MVVIRSYQGAKLAACISGRGAALCERTVYSRGLELHLSSVLQGILLRGPAIFPLIGSALSALRGSRAM